VAGRLLAHVGFITLVSGPRAKLTKKYVTQGNRRRLRGQSQPRPRRPPVGQGDGRSVERGPADPQAERLCQLRHGQRADGAVVRL
jgi:hypothetical protein